jgi:hypothetical protein
MYGEREVVIFFLKRAFILVVLTCSYFSFSAQTNPLEFKRHRKIKHLLAGQELKFDFPVNAGFIMASDRYGDVEEDEKSRYIFNAAACVGLRNTSGYGFSVGAGVELSSWGYISYNGLLNLNYFGAVIGEGKSRGSVFMFNRWSVNMIKGTSSSGEAVHEFYLRYNMLFFSYRDFNFQMGYNKGILRRNYPPVYSNSGLFLILGYTFQ